MDTHAQKISHLKALYHLACADNVLTQVELIYIRTVAERMGIKSEELEKFDGSEPDLELPDKEYKIYGLFHRLVLIVMIDNEAHDREKTFCFNLGIKMGLHPNAVNEIIKYAITHGAMATTPEKVMGIFRKFMN
jgi:hypothetical protein